MKRAVISRPSLAFAAVGALLAAAPLAGPGVEVWQGGSTRRPDPGRAARRAKDKAARKAKQQARRMAKR